LARQPAPAQDSFVGILERLTSVNSEFSIGTAYSDERKSVRLVGSGLKDLVEGNEYTFAGSIKRHAKFGEQFDVVAAMPYVKPDRNSIVKYISKNFKGVGPTTADKFISRRLEGQPDQAQAQALEDVRQQLLNAPWTLDFTGVTKKAKFKVNEEESPVGAYVHRDLATRLGGMPGTKDVVLKSLAQYLLSKLQGGKKSEKDAQAVVLDPQIIQKCWASLVQDPYEPTRHVPGYGFVTADAIGASVNIPRDAPVRIKALVAHALDLGCQRGGHTFLKHGELVEALNKLDPRVPAGDSIQLGLQAEMIILDDEFGDLRYYVPRLHDAETDLAMSLAKMCSSAKPLSKLTAEQAQLRVQDTAKAISPSLNQGLDPSQADALVGILTSATRLHTLTAGPGCGKTQLMEVLSKVLEHKDFVFCGPTGRSAKILSNRLSAQGREANTIHSTLMGAGRGSFRFNAKNTLDGDVLVVDESSMNDVELAEAITAAANKNMHLVLLGDDEQLPSIAPGRFLKDVLDVREADHHRLTKTHRNSGGILDVLEQVRRGDVDCIDRPGVKFSHGLDDAAVGFALIAQKYISAVSKYGGYEHVALIMSMRAGEPYVPGWNTTYSNQVLRDLCNPHALKIPGTRFFVGDRIIIRENMNVPLAGQEDEDEVRVVNGDTGTITSFEKDARNPRSLMSKSIRIKLDDGRMVDLPGAGVSVLQHSYALTVHSAQGSEYRKVISVVTPGHSAFMNRAMIFTGWSRAREDLDINGSDHVIRKIVATPLPARNSSLVERVALALEALKSGEDPGDDEFNEDDMDEHQDERDAHPRPPLQQLLNTDPASRDRDEGLTQYSDSLTLRQKYDMRFRQ